jgi:hypothetical protein
MDIMEFFGAYFLLGLGGYLIVAGWVVGGRALVCLARKQRFVFADTLSDALLWPWRILQ